MSFFDKLKNSVGVENSEEEIEKKEEPPKGKKIQIKGITKEKEPESQEWFQPEGELAVDVFQTENTIVIQSTIAGVKPEEIDLSLENDVVTISGERKNPNETEGEKSYFYQECYWGPFSRQIILPEEVDFSQAEATMKEGIFTLSLPKLQRKKVRRIKVRG